MVDAEYEFAEPVAVVVAAVEYAAGPAVAVVAYVVELELVAPTAFSQASASREGVVAPTAAFAQAPESVVFAAQTFVSLISLEVASVPVAAVVSAAPEVAAAASASRSTAFETLAGKVEEAVHSRCPALW